ncbi:universal stress protein [Salinigranum marinum]|uniref:universal stress protein n=1 Tax=Salinigranum marinum TaxID=1515595 RepID=UPI002989A0FB|nr:universal stress protein [Salinigranum marinum]
MGSVLLATDGSEYARRAAERAIELVEERSAPLYVICVVDRQRFGESALSSAELATIYAEDHAAACVAEVERMTEGRDISVEGDTRHGVPHEVIMEYADEVDADVIVVGEHGDHREHFAGVGRKVTERADREVIVVEAVP